jgi:CRISPR-associated endonuclease/helicase Cas3
MDRTASAVPDLMSLAAIEKYFCEAYWRLGPDKLDDKKIIGMFGISPRGPRFNFREAAEKFRMIESGMLPVVVPFDDVAKETVKKLAIADIPSGHLARKLQTFVVQIPPKARELLVSNKHVVFVNPEHRGDQFAVLQSESLYQNDVGLVWENADYLTIESPIV